MSTIDNCPIPDPCEDQEFKVTASASYPDSDLSWRVALPLAEFTIYRNSTYLLISLLIASISIIFTRLANDGDQDKAERTFAKIKNVLDEIIEDNN